LKLPKEPVGAVTRVFFGAYESWTYMLDIHCIAMYITAMKLQKELVAASSVPLVLSILTEGDSYGYAIIQRVKELSGGKIEWTDGMLYPVLHWLEDQDLVESRWEDSETGRKRKYYALKSEGRKALRQQKEQWALVSSVLNQLWKPHHA
jgi:DNA-binding PadR family transcriptional regulator